jgi:hypothetical protein
VLATRARDSSAAGEAARLLDQAFDRWREALAAAGAGASTWFVTAPSAARRLAEGVYTGVRRRLEALTPEERARWTARTSAAAESARAAAHAGAPHDERAELLATVVRLHPLTESAARAALELGDLALGAAQRERARGWYALAARESELTGVEGVRAALALRAAAVAADPAPAAETWQHATHAELAGSFAWTTETRGGAGAVSERWLRPGAVFLPDGRLALQTASEVVLLALGAAGELALDTRLRPADFLGAHTPEASFDVPREPPGWPLLPVADARGLVLVVGRTEPGAPNALLVLELERRPPFSALGLGLQIDQPGARLAWAIVGSERIDGRGAAPVPALEELGEHEFQPGPVVSADLVVAQARELDGQVRAWLLAFDRRDGRLAWKRLLASGADRVVTPRFAPVSKRVAGQPLLALDLDGAPRVFAGTHLGLGVLVDPLLGEPVWSFKNRRRGERERGWSGDRPLFVPGHGEAQSVVLWPPMDSDRAYALVPRAPAPGPASADEAAAVLARPPMPLMDAHTLLDGGADHHLVLGSTGKERTLSLHRIGRDSVDALDLGQDERFRGLGLASPERVWASTTHALYLFDRTRELYLLDADNLPRVGSDVPGGDLYARGNLVLVVGSSAVWSFRTR